jgi:hypothetical protein
MRYIVEQLVESKQSLGLGGTGRFYIDDRRLQRNLERVIADPAMTAAALAGVIADHRVVETLVKTDGLARAIVLQLEAKLGRRLGRERAQKLMAQYDRVRAARLSNASLRHIQYAPQSAHFN